MGSHLDPDYITGANWDQLGDTLFFLWGVPLVVIVLAFSLLFARAIIPSLVASGHLSAKVYPLRFALYGVAAVAVGLLAWVFLNLVREIRVIEDFYFKWWI